MSIDLSHEDSAITRILNEMEKTRLEVIKDEEFVEQDIYMDGKRFERCKFRHCRLFIKLGYFASVDCSYDHSSFSLSGPAETVGMIVQQIQKQ